MKIRWPARPVPVQLWPPAPAVKLSEVSNFWSTAGGDLTVRGAGQIQTRELLVQARGVAAAFRSYANTPTRRLNLCKQLLSYAPSDARLSSFSARISKLDADSRHYWIGTLYSLLMPDAERRRRAVYFTPPFLANAIISSVCSEGFDLRQHTAVDPAAGGAAFLSTLAKKMIDAGASADSIVQRLAGIEIDSGLARLSEALISERLGIDVGQRLTVKVANSLTTRRKKLYDLVIANPPYGRLFQTDLRTANWMRVCHLGHINKYALFTELCFGLVKPNGLVALVLPSSFVAGPLYDLLRTFVREKGELLRLGSVERRHDVFADVAQDVSVLIARVGAAHKIDAYVSLGMFTNSGKFKGTAASKLPIEIGGPWPVPGSATELPIGGSTLTDYGAKVRSGYFVWNRETKRMKKSRKRLLDLPLVWAKNIKPGKFCKPAAKNRKGVDFVSFEESTEAIVRTNAVLLQRTTNSAQAHRLIAARISPTTLKRWGGFISENHTIVITGPSVETLNEICALLNTKAADARYRRVSGTASVSVSLLRSLDLPAPPILRRAIKNQSDIEMAVENAYAQSAVSAVKASA